MDSLLELEQKIKATTNLYIYGAGIIAYGVQKAIRKIWGIEITAYIVTDPQPGKQAFMGRPLLSICDLAMKKTNGVILIATPSEYHDEIARHIKQKINMEFMLVGERLQYALLGHYYKDNFGMLLLDDLPRDISNKSNRKFDVYMAKSSRDKKLCQQFKIPKYIQPIQAGTALDIEPLEGMLHDNAGDNISERNRDYSELTVTYWVWKHCQSDYLGICHYRRMLDLSRDDYEAVAQADVDVVLPLPYLCQGDASFQYKRYVSEVDMNLLFSVLTVEERRDLREAISLPYIYNHNLLICKHNVFKRYNEYLFSILQRVDAIEQKDGLRNDRHLGYLGEILTSAFFTQHADELKIVHAPELWLV